MKKKIKKILIFLIIAVIAFIVLKKFVFKNDKDLPENQSIYVEENVEHRDISRVITGSGSLKAADSYSVMTLVEGEVLKANFQEGDIVNKDDILYVLDSSDAESSLEQAGISLSQSQRNYNKAVDNLEDLNIKSNDDGIVYSVEVELGDKINANAVVAILKDTGHMVLNAPFFANDVPNIQIGDYATVILDSTFEELNGIVTDISEDNTVLLGGKVTRNVEIEVENLGGLTTQMVGVAKINGIESVTSSYFKNPEEKKITSKLAGTVKQINITKGDVISKDDVVVVIESDTITDGIQNAKDSLRNTEISYDNRYKQLDNYTIKAPINGTIIDKNYNIGEKVKSGNVLCTIYDLSYLEMTLNVDELDISDIKVDQRAKITADAVEGKEYEGVITKVGVVGNSVGGITTYPVTIRIDETDGLLPGMNVDATITLESVENVLSIPTIALQRGNMVLVTSNSPSASGKDTDEQGYVHINIQTGVGNEDYIEIVEGLKEGDKIAYIPQSNGNNSFMDMMMGGGPNMGGGNRPSGGPDRGGF